MKDLYKLLGLIEVPKYRSKVNTDIRTPRESIPPAMASIPESEWANPNRYWLEPCAGRGTIALAIVLKLKQYHSDAWIADHLYMIDIDPEMIYSTGAVLRQVLGNDHRFNLIHADFLTWQPPDHAKKFNIMFNGPWTTTKKKTPTGTGGGTATWENLRRRAIKLMDAYLVQWVSKGKFIKDLREQTQHEVVALSLMTDRDYWDKNSCWATIKNQPRSNMDLDSVVVDSSGIVKCVSVMGDNPHWSEINGYSAPFRKPYTGKDGVTGIIKLAAVKKNSTLLGPVKEGLIDPKYKKMVPAGWKFVGLLQESAPSYLITNLPAAASYMGCYEVSSKADAEKIMLFVKNSVILKAIHRRLKTKGPTWTLRHIRPFDPAQIKTGNEIPKEWNLTQEEADQLIGNAIDIHSR